MSEAGFIECVACLESRPPNAFPDTTITSRCTHTPSLCIDCTNLSIASQTQNGLLNQLTCPECSERLDYEEVQRCTSTDVFARYHALTVEQLITKVRNFAWCPLGCGNGQVHDTGDKQPLVLCLSCERQFCFRHRVAWHNDYTCDEYDSFLADPQNFRSKAQAARLMSEESATNRIFKALTKPCPRCRRPIQKNGGW
ncbi:hypothetical protein F4809DRAFT_653488 [Biscogniauxia mediterranea]|nr:hypothetical protein F4809DRAFT_653488 [Biscogniauxia mediterranea]